MGRSRNAGKSGTAGRAGGRRGGAAEKAPDSPVKEQVTGDPGEGAGMQSASDAWLAIEVDQSAIQTLEEPAAEDGAPRPDGAGGTAKKDDGPADGSSEAMPPGADPGAGPPSAFVFPTEEDYGDSILERGAAPVDCLDLLCFGVAKETFAIDIRGVREIIRARPATELPGVPDFITGIISLRGEIMPVVDLRKRLGFGASDAPSEAARIVVASIDEKPAGILVDGVTRKVRLPAGEMTPPPAVLGTAEAGFLLGVCRDQGRLISVLNPKTVLDIAPLATTGAVGARPAGDRG